MSPPSTLSYESSQKLQLPDTTCAMPVLVPSPYWVKPGLANRCPEHPSSQLPAMEVCNVFMPVPQFGCWLCDLLPSKVVNPPAVLRRQTAKALWNGIVKTSVVHPFSSLSLTLWL